jgi:hypothetical protein
MSPEIQGFHSIDKIPNKPKGTLYVSGEDPGDTIYTASRDLTFNALSNSSVTLEFKGFREIFPSIFRL